MRRKGYSMIHFIKRAFLSVVRKPAKSIILMMTIFFLSNLIAGSYAISTSTRNSLDDLKEALGARLTFHSKTHYDGFSNNDKTAIEYFNEFSQSNKVSYSDYSFNALIHCKNIIHFKDDYYSGMDFNSLYLRGINQPNFYDLKNKDIVITRGRNFTEEEINEGSNYILLREEVFPCKSETDEQIKLCNKNVNSLKVGDKITLSHVVYQNPKKQAFLGDEKKVIYYEDAEYEIIGFYEVLNKDSHIMFYPESDGDYVCDYSFDGYISSKNIESHVERSIQLQEEYEQKYDRIDASFHNALDQMIIQLNYGENVKEFTEYIRYIFEQKDINSIFVASSDDSYRLISGPIESVSEISNIVLLLSIIASIIILAISSLSFLKERVHEIGIYLSLGEKKWKIAMQIVTEVFLIGIIAVTLSLPTGGYLGNIVCDKVIASNVEKTEQIIGDQLKELSTVNPEGITLKDAAEKVEIEYTSEYVIMLYGLCSIVLIISMIPPIIYILKLNPKKILM